MSQQKPQNQVAYPFLPACIGVDARRGAKAPKVKLESDPSPTKPFLKK